MRASQCTVFKQLSKCRAGATAVEYGLLAALLAFGLLVSLQTLGQGVSSGFESIGQGLADASQPDGDDPTPSGGQGDDAPAFGS